MNQNQPQRQPLDRQPFKNSAAFFEEFEKPRKPVILAGAADHWPALAKYRPSYLKSKYQDLEFGVSINLPTDHSPLEEMSEAHRSDMSIGDFVDLTETAALPCYLSRTFTSKFPGMDDDFDFHDLTAREEGKCWTFFWFGSGGTRSGLHFDSEDNLLAQVYGRKLVTMIGPEYNKCIPKFVDNIFSSPVDPEDPDLAEFPRFSRAAILHGMLHPGDVLFIPQGFWHDLRSLEPSISLSYVYGKEIRIGDILDAVMSGGPRCTMRTAVDFVRYGLFHGDYPQRIYSPPPTGKHLADLLFDAMSRRIRPVN